MPGYIYAITNDQTGEQYIGATLDYTRRIAEHYSQLRNHSHSNQRLQQVLSSHFRAGGPIVTYNATILEEVQDERNLAERERYWQQKRFLETGSHGYNSPDERPYHLVADRMYLQEFQSIQRSAFSSDEDYDIAREQMKRLQKAMYALGQAMLATESTAICQLHMFKRIEALFNTKIGLNLSQFGDLMPDLHKTKVPFDMEKFDQLNSTHMSPQRRKVGEQEEDLS